MCGLCVLKASQRNSEECGCVHEDGGVRVILKNGFRVGKFGVLKQ
jgi:hypothetical protein